LTIAKQLKAPVILCDGDLPQTEWRQAVRTLAALPHRPMVILLSKFADQSLWSEVFRIGGFDILRKPLRTDDVWKAVNLALSYWRRESVTAIKKPG
jgi:FixJ family two-component response regulator